MPTQLPFALGAMTQGVPMTGAAPALIAAGRQGGGGTASVFDALNQTSSLFGWVQDAPASAWTSGTDAQGNPTLTAAQGSTRVTIQSAVAVQQTPSTPTAGQFSWNGTNYNVVGTLTATLSYDEQPTWVVQVPLALAEAYPVVQLSGIVWSQVLRPLLTGFINGIRSCFASAAGVTSEAEAAGAAEAAADEAAIDGAVVADAEVSLVAGPAALVGLVVLLALPFILGALLHPTYHSLAIYNLTPYDVTWQLFLMEGAVNAEPTTGSGSPQPETLVPAMSQYAPPGITPVPVAHQASFSFASTSEVEGLGYAMALTLADPTSGAVVGQAALAFDVPYWGDNSLVASWGPIGDPDDYYSNMEGQLEQLTFTVPTTIGGQGVALTVTYDALDGEQPVPGGQSAYAYNSLAVLSLV